MPRLHLAICLFVILSGAVRLTAQVYPYRDGTPGVAGYRPEVMAEVMIQESEFVRLAQAIPADKYTWRPSLDVRTVAEVFLHASAATYNLYRLVGTPTPATVDTKTLEQSTTDKARVTATLQASYAHAKAAIRAMSDADLEKTLSWNGGHITERDVLLFIVQQMRATPWPADRVRALARSRPALDGGSSSEGLVLLRIGEVGCEGS